MPAVNVASRRRSEDRSTMAVSLARSTPQLSGPRRAYVRTAAPGWTSRCRGRAAAGGAARPPLQAEGARAGEHVDQQRLARGQDHTGGADRVGKRGARGAGIALRVRRGPGARPVADKEVAWPPAARAQDLNADRAGERSAGERADREVAGRIDVRTWKDFRARPVARQHGLQRVGNRQA